MILLDTDHLSVLADRRHRSQALLMNRLQAAGEALAIPIVAIEEQFRGWLAEIHRTRQPHRQIIPYLRLARLIDFLHDWQVANWNEPACDVLARLRNKKIRIGTQDLKIAAVAIANGALLLSANLRDFEQVPDLRVQIWLVERPA
jgi:tRNA(fMet)-specific endonuclease VapC